MNKTKKWFILVIFLIKSAHAGTTFSMIGIKEDPSKQEIKKLLKIEKDRVNNFKKNNAENEKQRLAEEKANNLKNENNKKLYSAVTYSGARAVKKLLKKEGINIEYRFDKYTPIMV